MIPKNIKEITEIDIISLIDNKVREGTSIDYKVALELSTDKARKKFLHDICAFCNTYGGDIIIGLKEHEGIPIEIVGVDSNDFDTIGQTINNLARDGLEPSLNSIQFRVVGVGEKDVLVIRIDQSWLQPHRVVILNDNRFFKRNSSGNFPMDIEDIRNSFVGASLLVDKVKKFRDDGLKCLAEGENLKRIENGPTLVVHLFPQSAFMLNEHIDIINSEERINFSPIINTGGWNERINLEGLLIYSGRYGDSSQAYVQVYRNGIVESVAVFQRRSDMYIASYSYEADVVRSVGSHVRTLRKLGIRSPIFIAISLIKAKGCKLEIGRESFHAYEDQCLDRDKALFPIEIIEPSEENIGKALKPLFDNIWNAFGYYGSPNYDRDKNFVLKK